jgi:hypothetical protein
MLHGFNYQRRNAGCGTSDNAICRGLFGVRFSSGFLADQDFFRDSLKKGIFHDFNSEK